jgi:CubicO group peptidase (beta-lactamase class C family)
MEQIIDEEYVKGRFNGTLYYVEAEQVVQINRGFANFQFEVEINDKTRFPLASVTKLFTAIAILQLQEKGRISQKTVGISVFEIYCCIILV